ncbi:MAG: cyclopropane fatty acyl phospholipid synthase [Saccharospirillum sp.]|uniref:cyclopropane fatty acyl phospholipid synthase n=1 Tax=Saccharospirillum sp. TaxID=2033801 RepID=UPI00329707EC
MTTKMTPNQSTANESRLSSRQADAPRIALRTPSVDVQPPGWIKSVLDQADIRVQGDRPWDLQVHNPRLYGRLLRHGSVGLAEAYIDGWWSSYRIDEMITRLLSTGVQGHMPGLVRLKDACRGLAYRLINFQSDRRAFTVGRVHYDIGNDLFRRMLDDSMMYSCAYWSQAQTLADAQQAKIDLICRKLDLSPGQTVLDIGCGWGGLAGHLARHYQVNVVGITVSQEQQAFARHLLADLPVDIRLADYRSLTGRFDRVVSVGMFEHVGAKNHRTFFETVHRLLADDGLFLLHTIGDEADSAAPEPFINKYIFPNGKVPSRREINNASLGLFRLEDWHNFGPDYDRTLMAWAERIDAAWPDLSDRYDERFQRLWMFYLYSCAAFFRSRQGQLWQQVYSTRTSDQEYRSVR